MTRCIPPKAISTFVPACLTLLAFGTVVAILVNLSAITAQALAIGTIADLIGW